MFKSLQTGWNITSLKCSLTLHGDKPYVQNLLGSDHRAFENSGFLITRNTINNFQKLNFKNEVYMTLKNNGLYTLYSIMKVWFSGVDLESMILSESWKAKAHKQICFKISESVPYFVGFWTVQI